MDTPEIMTKPLIRVKKLNPNARVPERASDGATGFDLYACLDKGGVTLSQQPIRVPTGIAIEAEEGLDVQIRPRSGLSAKGVMVTFGTIDPDYRGELLVNMYVLPEAEGYALHHGDRIAQLVITRSLAVQFDETDELADTERGPNGHGSTGR